ncbi:MAG TPA: hypothetical protein VGB67_16920, partial [Fibrella sp.]
MPFRLSLLLASIVLALSAAGQSYPPLPGITIPASFTASLPHTAHLLSTTSGNKPKQIRILVYGQSISVQNWWQQVKRFLQQRYPAVDII